MTIRVSEVARAHDSMDDEYDQLDDLWYPWLFAQIHEFIAARLPQTRKTNVALDVGCGTGFQSFLLARAGYRVVGFDMAERLIELARSKSAMHSAAPLKAPPLFASARHDAWIAQHHANLAADLEHARYGREITPPRFEHENAETFRFLPASSDVVCCCGSVLSFIDDYSGVLARMAEALVAGGLLFLEVEQRLNVDILWPLIDNLCGGRIGFEQTWAEAFRNLISPPGRAIRVEYPFVLRSGESVNLPIWAFSTAQLRRQFRVCSLEVVARIGVHQWTNMIPSTVLHGAKPLPSVARLFEGLRRLDQRAAEVWPFWRLGCSVVYCLRRR